MRGTVDPALTFAALRGAEAMFAAGLVCQEVLAALDALGLSLTDLTEVNFVTRSAPMGAAPAALVHAAFYNFNPAAIDRVIPAAWAVAAPATILAAQATAFSPVLSAALSSLDRGEVTELAGLSRTAAEAALDHREGRMLFAGLSSLEWPTGDHMVAWHAGKLLREHRGDGHVACLVVEGLSGIEALIVHEAFNPALPKGLLRRMRRWSDDEWSRATESLRERDWLTGDEVPTLTDEGHARRQAIEDRTNERAAVAFAAIGPAGVERMTELGARVNAALRSAGLGLGAHIRRFADPHLSVGRDLPATGRCDAHVGLG